MKSLAVLFFGLTLTTAWAQSQQIDIQPIKETKNEIRQMISDFKIASNESEVEAPEYRFSKILMLELMESKQNRLENYLSSLSRDFEKDYSIISNIKQLGNSDATKATVDEAKRRYKLRADENIESYQDELQIFITQDFDVVYNQCQTVLCINRVNEDVSAWVKIMGKVNMDLDLGAGAKLRKHPYVKVKDTQKYWVAVGALMAPELELVMSRNSVEFERLSDPSITKEEIKKYGSKKIMDYGIENLRK